MGEEREDYLILTRKYLRDYSSLRNLYDAWARETADLRAELASVPVAISKYGNEPGGGTSSLTETEREAAKRMRIEAKIKGRLTDMEEAKRIMNTVDAGLDVLPPEESALLRRHYIERLTWYQISYEEGYSEVAVRQRGRRALVLLAKYIFGLQSAIH